MSLTRSTEHLVLSVLIQGKSYRWDPDRGLDPSAIETVDGYIHQEAFKLERMALKNGLTLDDLIQEGHVGALIAAQRFDPCRGLNFLTYASHWIRPYLLAAARCGLVYVPAASYRKLCQSGELPGTLTSLDQAVSEDETALADLIPAESQDPDEAIQSEAQARWIRQALAGLGPKEREILHRRYGFCGDCETLDRIGIRMRMSRERIRQLQKIAERHLQARLLEWIGERPESSLSPSSAIVRNSEPQDRL